MPRGACDAARLRRPPQSPHPRRRVGNAAHRRIAFAFAPQVRRAREGLMRADVRCRTVAPCSHQHRCPLADSKWSPSHCRNRPRPPPPNRAFWPMRPILPRPVPIPYPPFLPSHPRPLSWSLAAVPAPQTLRGAKARGSPARASSLCLRRHALTHAHTLRDAPAKTDTSTHSTYSPFPLERNDARTHTYSQRRMRSHSRAQ